MTAHPSLSEHAAKLNEWLADGRHPFLVFVQVDDYLQLRYAGGAIGVGQDEMWSIKPEIDLFPGATNLAFSVYAKWPKEEEPALQECCISLDAAFEELMVERYREGLRVSLENAVLDRVARDELGGMKDAELK